MNKYKMLYYEKNGDYEGCFTCSSTKKLFFKVSRTLIAIMIGKNYTKKQIINKIKENAELILEEIPKGMIITVLLKTSNHINTNDVISSFNNKSINKIWYNFISDIETIDRCEYEIINGKVITLKCEKCCNLLINEKLDKKCGHKESFLNKYKKETRFIFSKNIYLNILNKTNEAILRYGNMVNCPLTDEEVKDCLDEYVENLKHHKKL